VPGEQRPEPAQQPLKALAARAGERLPRGRERLLERQPQQLVDQGVLAGEPPVQVPTPTPALAAISSMLASAPYSPSTSRAASRIRW
jgi:hypothetical protein